MMKLSEIVQGRLGQYIITKQLHQTVWIALYVILVKYYSIINATRNQRKESVIIKSDNHFCISNERDILLQLQDKTPFFDL